MTVVLLIIPYRLLVVRRARALSARSLFRVLPSLRMSMASCLELSKKLFWMVLVTERAPSFSFPPYKMKIQERINKIIGSIKVYKSQLI